MSDDLLNMLSGNGNSGSQDDPMDKQKRRLDIIDGDQGEKRVKPASAIPSHIVSNGRDDVLSPFSMLAANRNEDSSFQDALKVVRAIKTQSDRSFVFGPEDVQNALARHSFSSFDDEHDYSPFSALSSPPHSPFSANSSPPGSPLPLHFRKTLSDNKISRGDSSAASPFPVHASQEKKTQKRKSSGVDPKSIAMRRKKHNDLENKRRKKMNERYEQLHQLLGCPHTRLAILESAFSKLHAYESQIRALNIVLEAMNKQVTDLSGNDHNHITNAVESSSGTDISSVFEELTASLSHVPFAMVLTALNGTIMDCNDSFCVGLDFTKQVVLKSTLFALVNDQDLPIVFSTTRTILAKNAPVQVIDLRLTNAKGEMKQFHAMVSGIPETPGAVGGKPSAILFLGSISPVSSEDLSNADTSA